jgi:glycine cleavage system protein P-like pyridoxal-binding family
LSANYINARLNGHYSDALRGRQQPWRMGISTCARSGRNGVTMKTCLLMDYGFHAPTLSFPVRPAH